MKFRRRQPPTDFGVSGDEPVAAMQPQGTPEPQVNDPRVAPILEAQPLPPLEPPIGGAEVAASDARTPVRRPEPPAFAPQDFRAPSGWPIWLVALAVSVLWATAPIAFAIGYRNKVAPLTDDTFALAVFALLAVGPAFFVWGCAYMIRQGQKLAAETRRAKAMAEDMLSPALSAAARAGHVVQGVREEILAAGAAADQARETLLALRQAVAEETLKLSEATRASVRTAQDLAGTLGRERTQIGELAQTLDAQAAKVADTLGAQARKVIEASDAAGARLQEAEAALAETLEAQTNRVAETIDARARLVVEATDAAGDRLQQAQAGLAETLEGQTGRIAQSIDLQAARVADGIEARARRVIEATDAAGDRLQQAESGLAGTLDAQAAKVAEAVNAQARMVAEAVDVAETQLREAEAALSARAADLAAAAGEAGDAARIAGEDLTRHIARLETAGVGVAEQVRAVEGGLAEQRAALMTLSQTLRADHEGFASETEAHAERLGEFISQARLSAAEMNERATRGSETLKALMADAAEQFRDLAETAKAEREEFGQSTLQSLEAVSAAAAEQRAQLEAQTRAAIDALAAAAEQTRAAAASHAATAREQVDQLSEAAFTAGQKANQVFEARLEEARALIQQSSEMVEQAGIATARKLDEGAKAARATLHELQEMLGELEERASRIPAAARGQADQVRETVVQGMDELMAAARRTAEEAEAIDAAFQDRVRRNFEMLSEAVRLMGSVAAAPPQPLAPAPRAPAPPPTFTAAFTPTPAPRPLRIRTAAPPPAAVEPEPEPETEPEAEPVAMAAPAEPAAEPDDLMLDELAEPAPRLAKGSAKAEKAAAVAGAPLAARLGLRPRLKLTPTATDEEFSQVFEAAGGPPAAGEAKGDGEGGWSWKDLLTSIDGGSGDGATLEAGLAAELAKMGVDPEKLLPKARIDEIAAAVQTGDLDGARQVVKRLAPAATRRIVRRLFTDEALRRQVSSYVRGYQTLVDDAVVRDPEGFLMAELLGADSGRLYLLLDAAAGDMA